MPRQTTRAPFPVEVLYRPLHKYDDEEDNDPKDIQQGIVDAVQEVDVEGVEPMTSVTPMRLKRREDVVTDGNIRDQVLANAPRTEDGFFVVPKVVE